ncbi:hypothetical protein IHQ71_21085 [Rhizobium sp. TH2]|uniref:hypothetical protein n=1 Tax=Rhizobium sp. TH2 TaxID=2775403 RepID=UPI002157FBC1|nr:hypothetical protein [Rhizobium sp. TH2]UVC07667.1 hypothetical protein IHQ71_21085 [Rhizobium sp. TH2]
MKKVAHAVAGSVALLLVLSFLTITILSELSMDAENVILAKRMVLYGIALLIPMMAVTGGSGFSLAAGRVGPLVELKKKRMRLIAANGMLVMLPSAIWLYYSAAKGEFGTAFMVVQAIELVGGFTQLYLLGRNFRDGLRLSGRLRRRPAISRAGS